LPSKPRTLAESLRAYRIGDPKGRYPIFNGDGAAKTSGRWHERGQEVIYASCHYSTALLELLAHWNGILPAGQQNVEIDIPAGATYETVTPHSLANWTDDRKARAFGAKWCQEKRSAILIVPSFVARVDQNVVINCAHPDFPKLRVGLEYPVFWDDRLFSKS
jgi:RES domain-containing protein